MSLCIGILGAGECSGCGGGAQYPVLLSPAGDRVPPSLPLLTGIRGADAMEDEDEDSLEANKNAEDVLGRDEDLLGEAAGANEPKGPAQSEEKRENDRYQQMAQDHGAAGLVCASRLGRVATERDHNQEEHDPVEDIDDSKREDKPKPEGPLIRPTAKVREKRNGIEPQQKVMDTIDKQTQTSQLTIHH